MIERGDGGSIVNVSSVASTRALMDHLVYCEHIRATLYISYYNYCWYNILYTGTSKAGIDMVTKVMALELGPHKVSISLLIDTMI